MPSHSPTSSPIVEHMQCRMDLLARAVFEHDLCSEAAPYNHCGRCQALFFDP